MNKTFAIIILIIALAGIGAYMLWGGGDTYQNPNGQTNGQNEDTGNLADKANLIRVDEPQPNTDITSPVVIAGEARGSWFFEASFPVRVEGADGDVIAEGAAMTSSDWMTTDFVPFQAHLSFPAQPAGTKGTIVLLKDNPSGLPKNADDARYPITFGSPPQNTKTVTVHFTTSETGITDCTLTKAVERTIPQTEGVARAAINELLKGPTWQESMEDGFSSAIGTGVEIQSLTIEDGTARIDFNKALDENVGGSCRVAAIHAQIVNTLEEFPTVDEVVISIDGRTDDILQP